MNIREMLLHREAVVQPMRPHLKFFNQLLPTLLRRTIAVITMRTAYFLLIKLILVGLDGTSDQLKLAILLFFLHFAYELLQMLILLACIIMMVRRDRSSSCMESSSSVVSSIINQQSDIQQIKQDLNHLQQKFGEMQAAPKVNYIICTRGGYHTGEVLNMVCLQQQCAENQLCCCACVEQSHKDHVTRPLRLVMLQAEQASKKITPVKFNIDIALQLLSTHYKQSLKIFTAHKKQLIASLDQIQVSINKYYTFVQQQLKVKNVDPKIQIIKAFDTIQSKVVEINQYSQSVKKISSLLNSKKDDGELTEADIIASLSLNNDSTRKKIQSNIQQVNKLFKKYQKQLNQCISDVSIWKQMGNFKFSPTLKHPDVKIIDDLVVKAANNSGYKFAIMDPHLQKGNHIKKFAFKIKESSSNWVAVGMCHPKVVSSKSYGFNFSSIGHGAYMISANGGSWSHSKAEHNNSVKAFKFTKGDIIQIHVNPIDKTIAFKKNTENYQIPYEVIANDELSPCVLFYYINDEIEFLPNYKP